MHVGDILLDIGDGIGALVIWAPGHLRGREIEVSRKGDNNNNNRIHAEVHERRVSNRTVFAAVFASLGEGDYMIWTDDPTVTKSVSIVGGQVAEVDWR